VYRHFIGALADHRGELGACGGHSALSYLPQDRLSPLASRYRLRGRVLSLSRVLQELPKLRRYRLVVIDESHNLRNREGKRYRAIQEYLRENESKVILLSATPYNKTYLDLANQLRLFIPQDADLGIRPEGLLREIGETEFLRRHQSPVRSLAAFEKSLYADDWRELMRLYMVRRTRSFIQDNYAETGSDTGRKYLTFADGTRSYFPMRQPKTLKFAIDDRDPHDQYAFLLNRQLRRGVGDAELAQRVIELREEGRLCIIYEEEESQEPYLIRTLGFAQ